MRRLGLIFACAVACSSDSDLVPPGLDASTAPDAPPGFADAPPGFADAPPGARDASRADANPVGTVQCGDTPPCMALAEECCVNVAGPIQDPQCQDTSRPCNGVSASCDGPEDCALGGGECCFTPNNASCTAGPVGCTGQRLCHTVADCPGGTGICCPLVILGNDTGYGVCSAGPCVIP